MSFWRKQKKNQNISHIHVIDFSRHILNGWPWLNATNVSLREMPTGTGVCSPPRRRNSTRCTNKDVTRACQCTTSGWLQRCWYWWESRNQGNTIQTSISSRTHGVRAFVKDGTYPAAAAPTRRSAIFLNACIWFEITIGGFSINLLILKTGQNTGIVTTCLHCQNLHLPASLKKFQFQVSQNLYQIPVGKATRTRQRRRPISVVTAIYIALPRRAHRQNERSLKRFEENLFLKILFKIPRGIWDILMNFSKIVAFIAVDW